MKKFILKITLLVVAFELFNVMVLLIIPKNKNAYLCEYNEKIRLLESTPQPRMIFIGGSNLAFSIDSKTISDSLGYHVVNFGLHVGIGIRYLVEDALQYIRKGDIVVLQFEYINFFIGGNGDYETYPLFMVSTDWRNMRILNAQQWTNIIRGIPLTSFHTIERLFKYPTCGSWDTPVNNKKFTITASGFDKYGDEISHLNYPNETYTPSEKNEEKKEVKRGFINWLAKAIEQYEQAGATVIMLPPVCIKSSFYQVYNDHIDKALSTVHHPYIVPPSSMALDDSCVFNSGYHMNREGRNQNTQNIIRILSFLKIP